MLFFRNRSENASEDKNRGHLLLILIGATVGVLLLLFGGDLTEEETKDMEAEQPAVSEDTEQYRQALEDRIAELCRSVQGVDSVKIAVTLEGGFERIYATEWIDGNQRYVIVGSGSHASALLQSQREPSIAGIGVVCKGGGNSDVRRELLSLLSATFDLPVNRIYITEAKA